MKKYLMSGIAVIAFAAAFTSCSKSTDLYDAGAVQQREEQKKQETIANNIDQAKAQYAAAFEKAFGKVGANVDWGFSSTTRAFTRAGGVGEVIKPENGKDGIFEFTNDEKNANGWRSPEGVSKYVAPITDAEREWVQAWFDNPDNRGLSEEGREFHNFYVQQVYNKLYSDAKDNKNGYFWQMNNGVEEHTNKTYKVKMDQLRIGSARDEASTVHINDFNATDKGGNVWNAIYVKDGSSKQFGYYASYGSQWQWKFRCVELEVPASCFKDNKPHKGWYVGLSYYCDKVEIAGQKGERIGEDEMDICNDWILKIVPGEGETPAPTYRVIAEDLNATEASDFDFNDVVFDVVKAENNKTTLRLIACGGIYKLTVAGVEVHEKFDQQATDGKYPMINTGAKANINGLAPVEFDINGTFDTPEKINNIEIRVWKPGTGEDGIPLTAEKGKAACKILVDDSFGVVPEKQGIGNEYGLFSSYVQGGWDPIVNGKWWLKK